jgi:hypothetical protein
MLPETVLEPPVALASMISGLPPSGLLCVSGEFMTCVTVDDFENVEVLARRGEEIVMRWMLLDRDGDFLLEAAPDCVEFRRRSRTGKRSAAVAICGKQLGLRAFRPSDLKDQVIQCRNGKIGTDADPPRAGESRPVTPPVAGSDASEERDAMSTFMSMSSKSSGPTAATPTPRGAQRAAAGCSAAGRGGAEGWVNLSLMALLFALPLNRPRRSR